MSHDKIKAAARQRMARTGESYAVARLAVIREDRAAQQRARLREAAHEKAFEDGLAVELARYGEDVRAQLVYPSGLAEIQRRFAAQAARNAQIINSPAMQMAAQAARNAQIINSPAVQMAAQAAQHFASFWRQQGN
jgi:hypothetical protein